MKRTFVSLLGIVLLLALVLAAFPAGAAAETYTAGTMRLLRYEGDVEILDTEGVPRFVLENVRFDSGESMRTGESSLASVGMDDTKIVTLDAQTKVQFVQEGSHMLLNLEEGSVFVDVSEKLDENASFDIQTTTMTVGIRGTLVFVSSNPGSGPEVSTVGILEGTAQVDFRDASGTRRVLDVPAGYIATVRSGDPAQPAAPPSVEPMTPEDIAGFVIATVQQNDTLTERVLNGSPAGEDLLSGVPSGEDEPDAVEPHPADGNWTWPSTVQLVAQSASKLYDGTPLSRPGGVLVSGLPADCSIEVSAVGSRTDVGQAVNEIGNFVILNGSGENVTSHFPSVEKVSGVLRVDPAPLTIWTGSAEKVYDGTPLTCEEAEIRTVPGHVSEEPAWRNSSVVTHTALGSQTMVGISGSVWVHGTNPLTGDMQEISLPAGHRLSVSLSDRESEESLVFTVVALSVDEIPDEVLRIYAGNSDLAAQACADTGWDPEALQARIDALAEQEEETVQVIGLAVPADFGDSMLTDSSNLRINIDSTITNYNTRVLTEDEAHFTPVAVDPSIRVIPDGSQTEVGESENTYTVDWGNANPDNYVVVSDPGKLTVTPLDVEVNIGGGNVVYSGHSVTLRPFVRYLNGPHAGEVVYGTRHSARLPGVVSDMPLRAGNPSYIFRLFTGDTLTLNISGGGTDPGTYMLTGTVTSSSANVGCVDFSVTGTRLTIQPAPLTVVTGSASRPYDGTPLTSSDVEVQGLVNGDEITVTATGSQTEIGSSQNTCTIDWGSVNPAHYTVTESLGVLEVTDPAARAVTVTVTGRTDTKTYSGSAQSVEGYTVSVSNPLYSESDFTFSGSAVAEGTDAGTVYMGLKAEQFTNTNPGYDVTFAVTDGWLEITRAAAEVSVAGNTAVKPYSGEEQQAEGFTVTSSNPLYPAESVAGTAVAKGTEIGKYSMGLTADMFSNTNPNFDVTFSVASDGSLEITKCPVTVTVTGNSATVMYDGGIYEISGYTVSSSSPVYPEEPADIVGPDSAAAEGKTVGTYKMGLTADMFRNTNDKFDVTFTVTDGVLTVTPNSTPVTITILDYSEEYSGNEVFGYNADSTVTGLDDSRFWAYGIGGASLTDAGSVENPVDEYMIGLRSTEEDVTDYFSNVTLVSGTLSVTPRELSVTTPSDSRFYDGNPLPETTDQPTISGLISPDDEVVEIYNKPDQITDAGTKANEYAISWGTAREGNYTIPDANKSLGTLTVNPTSVTLTSASDSKVYDGTPLTSHSVTGDDGFAYGEGATYTFTGSQTDVGTGENTFSYTLNSNTKAGNYNITTAYGTLEVTKRPVTVTVTGKTESRQYTGEAQMLTGYDLAANDDLYPLTAVSFSGSGASGTEPGTYYMGLSPSQFSNGNPNFDVTFTVASDGALTVVPADVTVSIAGASATYEYNGDEHSVEGYEVVSVSNPLFSADDVGIYDTADTGGTVPGTYPMGLEASDFFSLDDTGHFNVTFSVTDGVLNVTKNTSPITVSVGNVSATYDGKPHTGYDAEPGVTGLNESKFSITVTPAAELTDVGVIPIDVSYVIRTIEDNTDVTSYFSNVTVNKGSLFVSPAPLSVTTADFSKVYDGNPLPETTDRPPLTGLVNEEVAVTSYKSDQLTKVGEKQNEYSIDWVTAKEENYSLNATLGTLTVSKLSITVSDNDTNMSVTFNNGTKKDQTVAMSLSSDDVSSDDIVTETYTVTLFTGDILTVQRKTTYSENATTVTYSYNLSNSECYTVSLPASWATR